MTGGSGFIGIHVVAKLKELNYKILNLDIVPPVDGKNLDVWNNVSIIDKSEFKNVVLEFNPNYIIYLSATTTQNAKSIEDFYVNIQGTKNLIKIANELTDLKKLIFASTQYVNSPGHPLSNDPSKLLPYGFYGESKLTGEELIRKDSLSPNWTIIRPTTIWGPWHPILAGGLWRQILKGRYLHPQGDTAIKAYGYVENTAWQIENLMRLDNAITDQQIYYLGDANIPQKKWVSLFVYRLTNRKLREIPRIVLLILSEIGEALGKLGIRFPLFRSRYRNLVTSNPSPLDKTTQLLGQSPVKLQTAVDRTCTWIEERHANIAGRARKNE